MRIEDFEYSLPAELIAQRPLERRDASRMLLLDQLSGQIEDRAFAELPEFLGRTELLVYNNAQVIPARLFGMRKGLRAQVPSRVTREEHLQGRVEVFLTGRVEGDIWEALVRPGRKLPVGEQVIFGDGELEGEITGRGELGLRTIRFRSMSEDDVDRLLEKLGHVPLPPYIEREDESSDRSRYQTVFARRPGAIAAPTAGLHFTPEILERIRERGADTCEITLNVGLGTFQPIHVQDLKDHVMHAESYEISEEAAEKISAARANRKKIVAVGTTVVRALEDSALRAMQSGAAQLVVPGKAEARLFITPGFTFRIVDALLTNFHLPRSTLLALVCAFAGRENVLNAYHHAVEAKYRFYSYGDCMLVR
ncbi:MAG TPA: tRNA preQ1(34) S-adenosylmethionine ribosyltransferase-isomerase QueA [Candidatus Dormibacteraeota bacterium]|nr:tRNA preQ1(34) S-adenosylmethionine ribosyltransferase-isomerase QueA [Candidatus Dormibacteraeota bacterium]